MTILNNNYDYFQLFNFRIFEDSKEQAGAGLLNRKSTFNLKIPKLWNLWIWYLQKFILKIQWVKYFE